MSYRTDFYKQELSSCLAQLLITVLALNTISDFYSFWKSWRIEKLPLQK